MKVRLAWWSNQNWEFIKQRTDRQTNTFRLDVARFSFPSSHVEAERPEDETDQGHEDGQVHDVPLQLHLLGKRFSRCIFKKFKRTKSGLNLFLPRCLAWNWSWSDPSWTFSSKTTWTFKVSLVHWADFDQRIIRYSFPLGQTSIGNVALFIITFGVVVTVISFFGCCGAFRESRCMILTVSGQPKCLKFSSLRLKRSFSSSFRRF